MKKRSKLVRLIVSAMIAINLFSMPVSAAESNKLNIIGISINGISVSISDDAYFSFLKIDNENYDVITSKSNTIGKIQLSFEKPELYEKLIGCSKTNFITTDAVYTDISYDDSDDYAILKYKVNDIKYTAIMSEDMTVTVNGTGDTVLMSNDNMVKILDNVNITF